MPVANKWPLGASFLRKSGHAEFVKKERKCKKVAGGATLVKTGVSSWNTNGLLCPGGAWFQSLRLCAVFLVPSSFRDNTLKYATTTTAHNLWWSYHFLRRCKLSVVETASLNNLKINQQCMEYIHLYILLYIHLNSTSVNNLKVELIFTHKAFLIAALILVLFKNILTKVVKEQEGIWKETVGTVWGSIPAFTWSELLNRNNLSLNRVTFD
jgi:hypothetical protein